jgi:hypothetical protein
MATFNQAVDERAGIARPVSVVIVGGKAKPLRPAPIGISAGRIDIPSACADDGRYAEGSVAETWDSIADWYAALEV